MRQIRAVLLWLWQLPMRAAILLIRIYQWTLSPLFGKQCRFTPSCSHYAIGALRKYGLLRGGVKSLWRICRCNPLQPGGYDPP